jgi:hypothetical protein
VEETEKQENVLILLALMDAQNKKKKLVADATNPSKVLEPSRWPVLREAVPAVHRPAFCRLEGHFALLPAIRTDCLVHVTRPAVRSAAPSSSFSFISVSHLFSPFCFIPRCICSAGASLRAFFGNPQKAR